MILVLDHKVCKTNRQGGTDIHFFRLIFRVSL